MEVQLRILLTLTPTLGIAMPKVRLWYLKAGSNKAWVQRLLIKSQTTRTVKLVPRLRLWNLINYSKHPLSMYPVPTLKKQCLHVPPTDNVYGIIIATYRQISWGISCFTMSRSLVGIFIITCWQRFQWVYLLLLHNSFACMFDSLLLL